MDNLKECPFCGKKDVYVATEQEVEDIPEDSGFFTVNCSYVSGGCGATSGYRREKEEAIKVWNRRDNCGN